MAETASYRAVFGVAEFRSLWLAQLASVAGDRLALVAASLLVYSHTHSAALAALTYASIYLPWLLGGPFLAGLADTLPRRRVMLVCDLARAVLVAAMIPHGTPLAVLVLLLFAVTTLQSPFQAARTAIVADVLHGPAYVLGVAVTRLTNQIGYVAGFAVGGVAVAAAGPHTALAVDGGTFLISALLVWHGVLPRPAVGIRESTSAWTAAGRGIQLVFGNARLRTLMMLGWLATFYAIPEGLAAPYVAGFDGGAVAVGGILAAVPSGSAIGTFVMGKFADVRRRRRWLGPMAVASCAPLLLCALRPGLAVSLVILFVAGLGSAFQLAANAEFVLAVPNRSRGRAYGLANAGLAIGQGLGITLAGVLAQAIPAATVIAISGGSGTVIAIVLSRMWRRIPSAGTVVEA